MATFYTENVNKWETVSKKKKASASDKKAARKNFSNVAPTVDAAPPLKESETIFDAFSKKHNAQMSQMPPLAVPDSPSGKKAAGGDTQKKAAGSQQKKKKDPSRKGEKGFDSLAEALKALDPKELKAQLTEVQTRCPEARSLWLGDIVGFMNKKLLTKESDPVFSDQPPTYPLSKTSKHLLDFLNATLKSYNEDMLKAFFDYCIRELAGDSSKGQAAVNGYRVFIQLIASKNPEFVTNSMDHYLTMVKRKQNDKSHCLSVLWSCAQAGYSDPVIGLRVWCGLMLPLLGVKPASTYAMANLDRTLRQKMDKQKAHEVLGPNQFFPILDFVFTPGTALPAQLQKQLLKHYSKLKSIAFGTHPETTLRHFFPSLLARTTVNCPEQMKNELLNTLIICLSTDHHCFSKWRQMYDTHLLQSSVLMNHMLASWEKVQKQLPRQLLKETVRAFHLTNEDMASSRNGRMEHEQCKLACKELLERMSGFEFPWRSVLTAVVLALVTFVALDVYSHKGLHGSLTQAFFERSGISAVCKHTWTKISLYLGIAFDWASVNVPIYYVKAAELCGPYLVLLKDKLCALFLYLAELTTPLWAWLAHNVPIALELIKAQIPVLWNLLWGYLVLAWDFLSPYLIAFWAAVSPHLEALWDGILHYSVLLWTATLPYLKAGYQWLQQMLSASS
ncbi:transmembrane protein 214-A-like [Acanthaster planci]|uniref:Transmembrane protein 214-A-like n=1 Tax=Acanthaster planci TaxID=133434 RepID=A0A8B7ZBC6_ACAPL|nr:transmembrane protein 214-A-like [Acanthaster planci]